MKKKIIQVVSGLAMGGAENLVKNYLLYFDRERYDVEALVTDKRLHTTLEQQLEAAGIKVTYLSELYAVNQKVSGPLRRLQVATRWRKAVRCYFRKTKPDVVHCHLSVARTLYPAAQQLRDTKLFYTVHSDPDKYWENGKNPDEQKAIRYFVEKHAMQFVALHQEAVEKIRKYHGEKCKVNILHNGVDLQAYAPTEEKRAQMRAQLGIPADAFVLGHVGRCMDMKNHGFLVDVFKNVVQQRPGAMLCLVGEGELKEQTMRKAEKLGIEKSVLFLGNRSDVPQVLSAFDVFVFPSVWEGFPLTMIEAQAARLPCFVSDSVNHAVKLTNLVEFLPLEAGAEAWAQTIIACRKKEYEDIRLWQYDIRTVLSELTRIYGIETEEQD